MRRFIFFVAVALSLSASIALADEITPIQHQYLKWTNLVYTAEQIDAILRSYVKQSERRYPMFLIPLNSWSSTTYSEFELKVSSDNFLSGVRKQLDSIPSKMVYWVSSTRRMFTSRQQDPTTLRKYVCDATNYNAMWNEGGRDARAYSEYDEHDILEGENTNVLTLTNKYPNYVVCIVDYDKIDDTKGFLPKEDWCISTNKNLTWAFVRAGTSADSPPGSTPDLYQFEKGTSGFVVWNPIFPVKWLTEEEYLNTDWINWEKPAKGQTESRKEYYKRLYQTEEQ